MGGGAEGRDPWRPVGWSMAAGAAYDLVFALAILVARRPAARFLGLELPEDPVYLRLVGVLLLLLAGMYAVAAREPERYRGVVLVAAGGRLLGALFFLAEWAGGEPPAFLGLAGGDFAFGLLHAVLLARAASAVRAESP